MTSKAVLYWVLGLILLAVIGCQPRSRADVDKMIAKSEKLSRIDRVCQSVPKPDDFIELKKGIFGNSEISSITYQYKTSRSFDSVVAHFKLECEQIQCSIIGEYDNKNDSSYRTLGLRVEGVLIGLEYRSEFGTLVNYSCSM